MSQFEFLLIIFIVNLFIVLNFNDLPIFKFVIDKPTKTKKISKTNSFSWRNYLMLNLLIYYFFNLQSRFNFIEYFFKNFKELNSFVLLVY